MGVLYIFLFTWLFAVFGETSLFTVVPWFKPNLFFLFSCIFCLRWRGFETLYIAVFLGLTVDCFSTIPFGIYGFSFLLISFFMRWYGIRIYQGSYFVAAIVTGVFTMINHLLVFLILNLFFSGGGMTFKWIGNLISYEVIPTVILSVPCLKLFINLESRYKIRLAERKF